MNFHQHKEIRKQRTLVEKSGSENQAKVEKRNRNAHGIAWMDKLMLKEDIYT